MNSWTVKLLTFKIEFFFLFFHRYLFGWNWFIYQMHSKFFCLNRLIFSSSRFIFFKTCDLFVFSLFLWKIEFNQIVSMWEIGTLNNSIIRKIGQFFYKPNGVKLDWSLLYYVHSFRDYKNERKHNLDATLNFHNFLRE